ncbi:serine hydrolase-like protein [Drosophila tropicalis]|uniref:serine hydrolase-like protein n=1 Tax=Drosophila tropicalis TaxID=46794 RepID=UPI0035ABE191
MGTLSLDDYEDVRIWAPWGDISGRWYGNRTERPILAIHGWLDNLGTFDTLIPLLPDYLGVLCIDLPGHGKSARISNGLHYSVLDYVYIIPRVMKEYKWTKISLLGHSLGGILSFVYSSLAPHTVDMIITVDVLLPIMYPPDASIKTARFYMEKHLIEDERQENGKLQEPPSYTLSQLREVISSGSKYSVPPEFAQHLLYRSVAKSNLYPDKYYFSRDGRIKFYSPLIMDGGLAAEMSRRIKSKPYLVIKGSESPYLGPHCEEALSILSHDNPHYEFYEVSGTHHVHLHNAEECAKYIVPFIRRHRPPPVASWSLVGEDDQRISKKEHRRFQERFFKWNTRQRSKL